MFGKTNVSGNLPLPPEYPHAGGRQLRSDSGNLISFKTLNGKTIFTQQTPPSDICEPLFLLAFLPPLRAGLWVMLWRKKRAVACFRYSDCATRGYFYFLSVF